MTREAVDLEAISLPPLRERRQALLDRTFLPFAQPGDCLTPDFLPLGGGIPIRFLRQMNGELIKPQRIRQEVLHG